MAAPAMIASALDALSSGVRFHPSAEEAVLFCLHRWVLGQSVDMAAVIHRARVYSCEPRDLAAAFPRLPTTDDRFFFTTCRRQKAGSGYRIVRGAGAGTWVSQTKKPVHNRAGEHIGFSDNLRFTYKNGDRESDWLMEEYHCFLPEAVAAGGTEERVFCRIYVSPRSPPGSVTRQESAAGDVHLKKPGVQKPPQEPLQQVAVPAVIAQPQALQRPAPPPCPVVQPSRVAAASSGTRQRRVMAAPVPAPVTTTQPQAPKKRPAPPVAEPPCPKRVHGAAVLPTTRPPVQPPPQVAVPPPRGIGMAPRLVPRPMSWLPEQPALLAALEPQRLRQSLMTSPPAARPRSPVAVPPPPRPTEAQDSMEVEDEASNKDIDMDEFASSLEEQLVDTAEEEQPAAAQAGDDMDDFASSLEAQLEKEDEQASSLEGLVVDEREDEMIAQDAVDVLKDIPDGEDDDDCLSFPLSYYSDKLFY